MLFVPDPKPTSEALKTNIKKQGLFEITVGSRQASEDSKLQALHRYMLLLSLTTQISPYTHSNRQQHPINARWKVQVHHPGYGGLSQALTLLACQEKNEMSAENRLQRD